MVSPLSKTEKAIYDTRVFIIAMYWPKELDLQTIFKRIYGTTDYSNPCEKIE